MAKKKSPETKNYIPPGSPVAIPPGDTGFKIVGKAFNRWIGTFKEWLDSKPKIINPDTNWDLNKKPMGKSAIKKKMKTMYLKESKDLLPGGLADGMTIEDIAKHHSKNGENLGDILAKLNSELIRGIKVEMEEHSYSIDIATEIAMDHLFEDPEYYTILAGAEDEMDDEKEKTEDKEGVEEGIDTDIPSTEILQEKHLKGPGGSTNKIGVKPGSAKIYPYLDVDSKKSKRGKKNLENLKDYRDWLSEGKYLTEAKKYKPDEEYKEDTRRSINLDMVRKAKEYENLVKLGFKETTSHQQELNNTMKFERAKQKQKEQGHDNVFYTIHPTGIVRRYNPEKGKETPEGSGNVIKKFNSEFKAPKDYNKALRYLWQYLRRKENRGDFR